MASDGPAPELVPADLHKAKLALDAAEKSFKAAPDSYETRDLAYVAQRKAQLAGALGTIAADRKSTAQSNQDFSAAQAELIDQGQRDLADSERRAAADRASSAADQAAAAAARGASDLAASEQRTADALKALATLASVKEDQRGLVITLSGNVLFESSKSELMASARQKLDQLLVALKDVPARNLAIEGHTDSQGADAYNLALSQRRADAVKAYLSQQGYDRARIEARGMGENSPIADNSSPEGRANNRRVEIIVEREVQARP